MITASPCAEILTVREVDDDQVRRLVDLLAEFGMDSEVKRQREHRSAAELGWLVLIALPLHGFLDTLGKKVAEDFYARICRVLNRGSGNHGSGMEIDTAAESVKLLNLQDSASGLRIELDRTLPAAAFQQLAALDLGAVETDWLRYDREAGLWRNGCSSAVE